MALYTSEKSVWYKNKRFFLLYRSFYREISYNNLLRYGQSWISILWWWDPVSVILLRCPAQTTPEESQCRFPKLRVRGWLHRYCVLGLEVPEWQKGLARVASRILRASAKSKRCLLQLAKALPRNSGFCHIVHDDSICRLNHPLSIVVFLRMSTSFCDRLLVWKDSSWRR